MSTDKAIQTLLEDILIDAYGEDEQLWAFRQAFEDEVQIPVAGSVIGEPVSVTKIGYDGNPQRGLRATCRKVDGKTYDVALADVEAPAESQVVPYGLCLWRLKRFAEAAAVLARMLWLNPADNQGARFELVDIRAEKAWDAQQEEVAS